MARRRHRRCGGDRGGPAGLADGGVRGLGRPARRRWSNASTGGQAGTSVETATTWFPVWYQRAPSPATEPFSTKRPWFGTEMVYAARSSAYGPTVTFASSKRRRYDASSRRTVATGRLRHRRPITETFNGVGATGPRCQEARVLTGEHACVVGGGNSAGRPQCNWAVRKVGEIVVRSKMLLRTCR